MNQDKLNPGKRLDAKEAMARHREARKPKMVCATSLGAVLLSQGPSLIRGPKGRFLSVRKTAAKVGIK